MREILRGSLNDVGLPSLLQLLEAEATTGWLTLERSGRVGVRKGQPVAAELGALTGVHALLDLFTAPSAGFTVHADAQVAGAPLGDVLGFVLEGCRLSDEWNRVSGMVLVSAAPPHAEAANPSMDAVLPHLDGHRTVADAIAASGLARCVALDPLLEALDRGALRPPSQTHASARERSPLPDDYASALELGRSLLRSAQLDAAEAAFSRALALRPGDRVAAQNLRRARQLRSGAPAGSWWSGRAS